MPLYIAAQFCAYDVVCTLYADDTLESHSSAHAFIHVEITFSEACNPVGVFSLLRIYSSLAPLRLRVAICQALFFIYIVNICPFFLSTIKCIVQFG